MAAYARLEKVPRKTPEKPVDNEKTDREKSWSAKSACAERREGRPELVAGEVTERATFRL
jgi:hypothetical protein